MKIPKTIDIGPHTFKVILESGLGTEDNFGKADMNSLTIFVRDNVPQSLQEETFIHECLHMIRALAGIEDKDDDMEEAEVQAMGAALAQVIRQLT